MSYEELLDNYPDRVFMDIQTGAKRAKLGHN